VTIYSAVNSIADFALAPNTASPAQQFERGDCNDDATFNIADMIYLLGYLFSGGPDGPCIDSCDANDDGALNIADAIAGLGSLFGAASPLPDPFLGCGEDPTADGFDCLSVSGCP